MFHDTRNSGVGVVGGEAIDLGGGGEGVCVCMCERERQGGRGARGATLGLLGHLLSEVDEDIRID